MMMKKSLGILFMVLSAMTSCTFEEEETAGTDRLQDVYIKFENVGTPGTRSEETSKTGTDKVSFSNGYIFFLTGQDNVKKCYHILPAGSTANKANNEIELSDFWGGASSGGYLFSNVSGEVTKVYLIGNMPSTISDSDVRSKTTFAKLKELTAGIETQSNVDRVLIDGSDALQTAPGGDATKKVADITLVPLCSRIEIAKFTAGGAVAGYKLQGIYVSHFYNKMAFNETSVAANLEKYAAGGGADYAAKFASLCDVATVPATGLGTQAGLVTTPATSTNVWAYQFFPGNNTGRVPPRIVIKLNGVSVNAGYGSFDSTKDYFLNIRGFKASGAGDVDPMALERGKVYKIANVAFKENDLSDVPNPADIDLTVTVEVAAWVPKTVEPIM